MTYVLIPGAGGSGWYWHLVEAELVGRGYDVVTVDLPAEDEKAGLIEYVDTVLGAVAGRSDLVVVGQSLGGFTAAEVATTLPVRELIFVNAMIPLPGESAGEWWSATGQDEARRSLDVAQGRDPDAEFDVSTYFLHDVPAAVVAQSAAHDREQCGTIFGSPCTVTDWPDVPIRALSGRDDRFFPFEFQRRVARERLGIEVEGVPGGHLAALSHPVELADGMTISR